MGSMNYFDKIIELAPVKVYDPTQLRHKGGEGITLRYSDFADNSRVNALESEYMDEISRFIDYLIPLQQSDRVNIIEYHTGRLMMAYYDIRAAMEGLDNNERDNGRPSMNLLCEAIMLLISHVEIILKIEYSKEFIDSWAKRTSYFPFFEVDDDIGKPNVFVNLDKDQIKFMFDALIAGGFISSDFPSFEFVFGDISDNKKFKPIEWLKNKELARQLLHGLKKEGVGQKEVNKFAETSFIQKEKPLTLCKPKKNQDVDADFIGDLLKKMRPL